MRILLDFLWTVVIRIIIRDLLLYASSYSKDMVCLYKNSDVLSFQN